MLPAAQFLLMLLYALLPVLTLAWALLAGDGVSDDVESSEVDLGELLDEEGLFHEVGRVTGGGVQGKRICAFGR